jgi:hypothetical protein
MWLTALPVIGAVRALLEPVQAPPGVPVDEATSPDAKNCAGVRHRRIHRRAPMSLGYAACPAETGAAPDRLALRTGMLRLGGRFTDEMLKHFEHILDTNP